VSAERRVRIGELARRTGTTPELLRAWEQRYGLFDPVRTAAGYRLYSASDEQRVRAMRSRIAEGLSAAQAARSVRAGRPPADALTRLEDAFARFDAAAAEDLLDQLLTARPTSSVILDVVLPVLHAVGERTDPSDQEIATEHFASNLVSGRLRGLAGGWDLGTGPRAVLACPSGERHDLGLIAFGLALREQGWRITLLGHDTPSSTIERTAITLAARAVVLAAVVPERFADPRLAELGVGRLLAIGGAGARTEEAGALGALLLQGDPYSAAAQVAAVAAG
jgi:MerR family transcriptional regulator, light-induced transcriptional regulator